MKFVFFCISCASAANPSWDPIYSLRVSYRDPPVNLSQLTRVERMCRTVPSLMEEISTALVAPVTAGSSPTMIWEAGKGPQVIEMARVESHCREDLLLALFALAHQATSAANDVESAEFIASSRISPFCALIAPHAKNMRRNFKPGHALWRFTEALPRLCPGLLESSREVRLLSLDHHVAKEPLPVVDAKELYSRVFGRRLQSLFPRKMWPTFVSKLVFEPSSTDPVGGLFELAEDSEFLQLDLERPLNEETRAIYQAAGRLLASSLRSAEPIGARFPSAFYRQLLDESSNAEGPEADRIAEMRVGFASMIPLETVTAHATMEDIQARICGITEVSVAMLKSVTFIAGHSQLDLERPVIWWVWNWLERANNETRRQFLEFVTGSRQLPIDGPDNPCVAMDREFLIRLQNCQESIILPSVRTEAELHEWLAITLERSAAGH